MRHRHHRRFDEEQLFNKRYKVSERPLPLLDIDEEMSEEELAALDARLSKEHEVISEELQFLDDLIASLKGFNAWLKQSYIDVPLEVYPDQEKGGEDYDS